jgi:hypothetical protein
VRLKKIGSVNKILITCLILKLQLKETYISLYNYIFYMEKNTTKHSTYKQANTRNNKGDLTDGTKNSYSLTPLK